MWRKLKFFLGVLLCCAGVGWWLLLLGPEIVEKRQLPGKEALISRTDLAPGSVLVVVGAFLAASARRRHATPEPK